MQSPSASCALGLTSPSNHDPRASPTLKDSHGPKKPRGSQSGKEPFLKSPMLALVSLRPSRPGGLGAAAQAGQPDSSLTRALIRPPPSNGLRQPSTQRMREALYPKLYSVDCNNVS